MKSRIERIQHLLGTYAGKLNSRNAPGQPVNKNDSDRLNIIEKLSKDLTENVPTEILWEKINIIENIKFIITGASFFGISGSTIRNKLITANKAVLPSSDYNEEKNPITFQETLFPKKSIADIPLEKIPPEDLHFDIILMNVHQTLLEAYNKNIVYTKNQLMRSQEFNETAQAAKTSPNSSKKDEALEDYKRNATIQGFETALEQARIQKNNDDFKKIIDEFTNHNKTITAFITARGGQWLAKSLCLEFANTIRKDGEFHVQVQRNTPALMRWYKNAQNEYCFDIDLDVWSINLSDNPESDVMGYRLNGNCLQPMNDDTFVALQRFIKNKIHLSATGDQNFSPIAEIKTTVKVSVDKTTNELVLEFTKYQCTLHADDLQYIDYKKVVNANAAASAAATPETEPADKPQGPTK